MVYVWSVLRLAEMIEKRVKNKFDCIIFVSGERGTGKSTLIYKLCHQLNLLGNVKFDPEKNIVYSREDTLKLLANEKNTVIFSDELINVSYNRDFYEKDQKLLLKALNMYRDSSNVFIGAIPKFADLDNQIQRLCKIRLHVKNRGNAMLFIQQPSIFNPDSWGTKSNLKLEESKGKRKKLKVNKLIGYKGIIRFFDLNAKQRKLYDEIKRRKRGQVFSELVPTEDRERSPTDKMYDKLIELGRNNRLTHEALDTICLYHERNIETVKKELNRRFKALPEPMPSLKELHKRAYAKQIEIGRGPRWKRKMATRK